MRYRTTVRLPGGVTWFLRGVAAGCVLLCVAMWWFAGDQPVACAIATAVLLGVAGVLLALRGRIEVDPENLRLTVVPLFTKTLPRAEITSVELSEVDPWGEFGGYGYKVRRGDVVAFAFSRGPAVRLTTREGRTYVITDPAAAELRSALGG
ncbi:hypothetical protein [Amycolatopsis sp. 195334CR]|uniref:hypothetical protein n=1 Tax=Amycolatopsis sp. 195334CR TaxID=2814588 RepID=UPI001A8CE2C6|nr:hypothetical protein [Amycolatopsis sp. 195334CR]MBN6037572.1 hypothetical protein [Amycolatopsis sp. 195334CR]